MNAAASPACVSWTKCRDCQARPTAPRSSSASDRPESIGLNPVKRLQKHEQLGRARQIEIGFHGIAREPEGAAVQLRFAGLHKAHAPGAEHPLGGPV